MSKVRWHIMMSLDGFVAGPDDDMDWAHKFDDPSPQDREVVETTGAIRRARDVCLGGHRQRARRRPSLGRRKERDDFGADIAHQVIAAGRLDEILIHVVPVLLGEGTRLYGAPGPTSSVDLELTDVARSGRVADVAFKVRK